MLPFYTRIGTDGTPRSCLGFLWDASARRRRSRGQRLDVDVLHRLPDQESRHMRQRAVLFVLDQAGHADAWVCHRSRELSAATCTIHQARSATVAFERTTTQTGREHVFWASIFIPSGLRLSLLRTIVEASFDKYHRSQSHAWKVV